MKAMKREARFILGATLLMGLITAFLFLPYLNVLTLALVIAVVFMPLTDWLRGKIKRDSLAAAIALLAALIVVVTPLTFFAYQAGQEGYGLYNRLADGGDVAQATISLERFQEKLPESIKASIPQNLDVGPTVQSVASWVFQRVGSVFSAAATLALSAFLLIVGTYYMLKDGHRFLAYVIKVLPVEDTYEKRLVAKIRAAVISVVRGSLLIALIQGIAAGIGFFVFGVPNSVLWGSATVVASLVPIIGTALTIGPAVVYLALIGKATSAILLMLWGLIIVGLVDNAFRGQLMNKGLDIHPFLILLSVLGGLQFFGPIGFITGPLILAVLVSFIEIYMDQRKRLDSPGIV